MSNMNTVFALYNLPGVVSATETAVPTVVGGTTRALMGLTSEPAASQGLFDGHPFKIRVVAKAVGTGASNFTVNLYWNSANNTNLTTFTSDVLVNGSGAQALASKPGMVFTESVCVWDSALLQLSGYTPAPAGFSSLVTTPNLVTPTAATKINTSGVIASTGVSTPNLVQFFVTFTCSTAANVSSATLTELSIERI